GSGPPPGTARSRAGSGRRGPRSAARSAPGRPARWRAPAPRCVPSPRPTRAGGSSRGIRDARAYTCGDVRLRPRAAACMNTISFEGEPMSDTTCHMSMSLDGFVAGPDQSRENPLGKRGLELHGWHLGDERANEADATVERRLMRPRGAYVMGRNMYGPIRGEWDEDWRGWWG